MFMSIELLQHIQMSWMLVVKHIHDDKKMRKTVNWVKSGKCLCPTFYMQTLRGKSSIEQHRKQCDWIWNERHCHSADRPIVIMRSKGNIFIYKFEFFFIFQNRLFEFFMPLIPCCLNCSIFKLFALKCATYSNTASFHMGFDI